MAKFKVFDHDSGEIKHVDAAAGFTFQQNQ
jgi:hypothetical protein